MKTLLQTLTTSQFFLKGLSETFTAPHEPAGKESQTAPARRDPNLQTAAPPPVATETEILKKSVDDSAKIAAELEETKVALQDTNQKYAWQEEIAREIAQERRILQEQLDRSSVHGVAGAKAATLFSRASVSSTRMVAASVC